MADAGGRRVRQTGTSPRSLRILSSSNRTRSYDLEIGLDLGMRRGGALLATPGGTGKRLPSWGQKIEDEDEDD